ncbi:hypothetical protein EMCRGX_G018694 [Ephydatia muelleri]
MPVPQTSAVQAAAVINDTNPPVLTSFILDRNTGILSLSYSEVVVPSSLQLPQFSLQSGPNSSAPGTLSYVLSGGIISPYPSTIINVTISQQDLFAIESMPGLAMNLATTYLSFTNLSITDTRGYHVIPRDSTSAQPAGGFYPDMTSPALVSFNLDMNLGLISLTFTEIVNSLSSMVTLNINSILDTVKANSLFCTSRLNTYLVVPASVVMDTSRNLNQGVSNASMVNLFTPDTTNPTLLTFDLDMNANQMVLVFSETVQASTLQIAGLMLQSSWNRSASVLVPISITNMNMIKGNIPTLATGLNNTFLYFTPGIVYDMAGNALLQSGVVQVRNYTRDSTGPSVESFTLDLNTGVLAITFYEYVNASTLNESKITIYSSMTQLGAKSYTLTNTGSVTSSTGIVIKLALSNMDLNEIKKLRPLATSASTTVMSVGVQAILDMSSNAYSPPTTTTASGFINDTTRPYLVAFSMNMNSTVLSLSFSETMDSALSSLSLVTLSSGSSQFSPTYNLSNSMVTSGDSPILTIKLSRSDFNTLTQLGICISGANCYISFVNTTFQDTSGNLVTPVSSRLADSFSMDATSPTLQSFVSFDLNTGIFVLQFSETVNMASVNFTSLRLDGVQSAAIRYTLTGGSVLGTNSDSVTIQLTADDLNGIKIFPQRICYDQYTCFVGFNSTFIKDISGNGVVPIAVPDVPVLAFTPDTTGPTLTNFDLDMNTGKVVLQFNEPITISSLLVFTALTIADSSIGLVMYTLTTGTRTSNQYSIFFNFTMSSNDVMMIKATSGLATSNATTYLNFTSDLVQDISSASNPVNTTSLLSGLWRVRTYIPDTTPPFLVRFVLLDMNVGELVLSFSEPMSLLSLNASQIVIQNSSSSTPLQYYVLTSGTASYQDPLETLIRVSLSAQDLLQLKTRPNLATSLATSYISMGNKTIQDVAGNGLLPVIAQAFSYTRDSASPQLTNYTLDMNTGLLLLTFSNVMNNKMVNPSSITFSGVDTGTDLVNLYTLTGGSVTDTTSSYETHIQLTSTDLNQLKKRPALAKSISTTYLSTAATLINNVAGQPVLSIIISRGQIVSTYIPDTTPPSLLQFSYDENAGTITLFFNETVNVSSFDPTFVTLQSGSSSGVSYRLTGGYPSIVNYDVQLALVMSTADLNTLKTYSQLYRNVSYAYLFINDGAILDMSYNKLLGISNYMAINVATFTFDKTPPYLSNFTFDRNSGQLLLTVSETVSSSSIDPASFVIQGAMSVPMVNMALYQPLTSTSTLLPNIGIYQTIQLSTSDLNAIKTKIGLATSLTTTYLSFTSSAIKDLRSNNATAVSQLNAIQAVGFLPDTTPPTLLTFSLLYGPNQIVLTFSETVNCSSLQPTFFTLVGGRTVPQLQNFTLTGASAISQGYSDVVNVSLLIADVNGIKAIGTLGTTFFNTYMVFSAIAVNDTSRNPIASIDVPTAVQVGEIGADTVPPQLVSSTLNLSSDTLLLVFSETVSRNSFTITQLSIQNAITPTDSVTLSGGTIPAGNNYQISIALSTTDLNNLKLHTTIATAAGNAYISFTNSLVTDIAGNPISTVTGLPITTYVRDNVNPSLVGFDLVLDTLLVPPIRLVLYFSEPIRGGTLNAGSIVLQLTSNISVSSNYYQLNYAAATLQNSPVFNVTLGLLDFRAIQQRAPLARSAGQLFVSIGAGSAADMAGNNLTGISNQSAIAVNAYSGDLLPPVLSSFSLDLNFRLLILTWNKPLTSGTVAQVAPSTLQISLTQGDLNNIYTNPALATMATNTYIVVASDAVYDTHLNPNELQGPLPVLFYTVDRTSPTLLNFDLNMNTGMVTFVFSETVNSSILTPSVITLQNALSFPASSYTLTGGTVVPSVAPSLMFNLTLADLNGIKRQNMLATSSVTTFIAFGDNLISDMHGNRIGSVSIGNAKSVRNYTADSTNPSLLSFDFDRNLGMIILHFDETVNVSSLLIQQLTLSGLTAANNYTLSNSYLLQGNSEVVSVLLSSTDLNTVKSRSGLCTNSAANDCFITVPRAAIRDMSMLAVSPQTRLRVSVFINDVSAPSLASFVSINMQTGTLVIQFNETVDFSTLYPPSITLQNLFEPPCQQYILSGGNYTQLSLTSVQIQLTMFDLASLKRTRSICTYRGNCYFVAAPSLVNDTSGNMFAGIPQQEPGFLVRNYTGDTIPPHLSYFDLDLNANHLVLVFDEPVDLSTLIISRLTLQSQNITSNPQQLYALTSGVVYSADSVVVMINMSITDVNTIKSRLFATSAPNTYLVVAQNAVFDLAILSNAIQGCFTLDLSFNELVLTFNEPVRTSTFNITGISILQYCGDDAMYTSLTLSGGSFRPANLSDGAIIVPIVLTPYNVVYLKSITLATAVLSEVVLNISSKVAEDIALQKLQPINCAPTTTLTPDDVRMQLVYFDLDLNVGVFNLTFDDVVDPITWHSDAIRFQTAKMASPGFTYTLTPYSYLIQSQSSYSISVQLSSADLLGIKSQYSKGLASSVNTTYITVQASAIRDVFGTDLLAITNGRGIQVRNYYRDITSPILVYSTFDRNQGVLNLTFSDFPDPATISFAKISIKNSNGGSPTSQILSQSPIAVSQDGFTISIYITSADLNQIKATPNLASNNNNTYISLAAGVVNDYFGNTSLAVSPRLVNVFVQDTTNPVLVGFGLNMNSGLLILTFSETVNISTVNTTAIVLQDIISIPPGSTQYRLTGSNSITAQNLTRVAIILTAQDLFGLQATKTIGSSYLTTFISIDSSLITDTSETPNAVVAIPQTNALQVQLSNFVTDIRIPVLSSFIFDLNTGVMSLTFTKVIQVNLIPLTSVSLVMGGTVINLTGGYIPSGNSAIVNISVLPGDLNRIKVVTASTTPYISFSMNVFIDVRGFSVPLSYVRASNVTSDTTPPTLTYSQLDMNIGNLTFIFSEAVQQFMTTNATLFIQLSSVDLNALKSLRNIAISQNTTYFNIQIGLVSDYASNSFQSLTNLTVNSFIPDTTGPTLISFVYDTTKIVLVFDEAVDLSTFLLSDFGFNSAFSPNQHVPMDANTTAIYAPGSLTTVWVQLGLSDLSYINSILGVANDPTVVGITNLTIYDFSHNKNQPLGSLAGGSSPTLSTAPPQISSASLDLNTGTLTLAFTKRVSIGSIIVNKIYISSANTIFGVPSFQLTGNLTTTINSSVLNFVLSTNDLNTIMLTTGLARGPSSTYIILLQNALADVFGNAVGQNGQSLQVQNFIPLTIPPVLQAWDLDRSNGTISLYFNEPVLVSSISLIQISLQESATTYQYAVLLTSGGTPISAAMQALVPYGGTGHK